MQLFVPSAGGQGSEAVWDRHPDDFVADGGRFPNPRSINVWWCGEGANLMTLAVLPSRHSAKLLQIDVLPGTFNPGPELEG